ncbi:nuclear RNA-splicing-associated protein-domain-containing protein [Spinellus fusiger]|nr:nuclear RNA-splicing-associated protein-domain-containing protein [Spinellus fusiger]KAI7873065.1 nuclear RNA-splicing-associated protein-domain-containing protein [Spinellus fusiger]
MTCYSNSASKKDTPHKRKRKHTHTQKEREMSTKKKRETDTKKERQKTASQTASQTTSQNVIDQLKALAQKHNKETATTTATTATTATTSHSAAITPKTKAVYDKERSVIRSVYDPQTGRTRRVRATGEVLETIVTRDQHYQINKTAKQGDGVFYQAQWTKQQ